MKTNILEDTKTIRQKDGYLKALDGASRSALALQAIVTQRKQGYAIGLSAQALDATQANFYSATNLIDADGGYPVSAELAPEIFGPLLGDGSFLARFSPFPAKTNLVQIAIDPNSEASLPVVVEDGELIASSKPELKATNVLLKPIKDLLFVSGDLLRDSANFALFTARRIGARLAAAAESYVISGTGQNQPTGLRHAPGRVVVVPNDSTPGKFGPTDVCGMLGRLLPGGLARSFWVASPSALAGLGGVGSLFANGLLASRPLVVSEFAAHLGSEGDLTLVDPAGCFVATRGSELTTTISLAFDQDLEAFRGTLRLGCAPVLAAPVEPVVAGGVTRSHVVVLAGNRDS